MTVFGVTEPTTGSDTTQLETRCFSSAARRQRRDSEVLCVFLIDLDEAKRRDGETKKIE
jgi:hypothetical protein